MSARDASRRRCSDLRHFEAQLQSICGALKRAFECRNREFLGGVVGFVCRMAFPGDCIKKSRAFSIEVVSFRARFSRDVVAIAKTDQWMCRVTYGRSKRT